MGEISAVNLKVLRRGVAVTWPSLNTSKVLHFDGGQKCRFSTLMKLKEKGKHKFFAEAGINRVLQEEDVNDMRAHSIRLLEDPITSITVYESQLQQVTLPKSDRTPVHEIYWKLVGQFRHKSVIGRRLIALCLERVDCKPLRDLFQLNEGFNHRFFFLVLHVWLLHQRLTLEGWKGEMADDQLFFYLQLAFCDWMWTKNVSPTMFGINAQHCQAIMYGFCVALDQSLEQIDILPARIHETLWLHVYQADINPDEEYLDTLTKYVIRQWSHVLQLERDHILEGMFSWANFPVPGMPRSRAIHPFSQQYQDFGYSPRSWDKLKQRLGNVNKRTEMACMKDYGGS